MQSDNYISLKIIPFVSSCPNIITHLKSEIEFLYIIIANGIAVILL